MVATTGAEQAGTSLLSSPRTNLQARLRTFFPPDAPLPPAAMDAAVGVLLPSDAENKLQARKLYLVLDLDETLVYAHKLEPGASPVGSLIHVRGTPYDLVPRPGLKYFLEMARKNFVVSLYTMGDADYAKAVMRVIDPDNKYFRGNPPSHSPMRRFLRIFPPPRRRPRPSFDGLTFPPPSGPSVCVVCACSPPGGYCCWRPSESRQHKSLTRVMCDRRMALIVDDSVDVWGGDLANLCLTRRFVGDKLDDGLQLLSWQLSQAHQAFFAFSPPEGYSLEAPAGSPRAPPTIFSIISQQRGEVLKGCRIALTGIVTDLSEETLEGVPLGALIQLYGGEIVLNVDQATHLVARRKDGWKSSPKIRKAFRRLQVCTTRPHASSLSPRSASLHRSTCATPPNARARTCHRHCFESAAARRGRRKLYCGSESSCGSPFSYTARHPCLPFSRELSGRSLWRRKPPPRTVTDPRGVADRHGFR